MLLVARPQRQRIAINRLPDLFRTGRSNRTILLVVTDAGFLERQATVVEQGSDLGFEVVDDFLVANRQDFARQYRVPVVHQPRVVSVVVTDVLEAVGKFLAAGEQLLEVREPGRHRLPPPPAATGSDRPAAIGSRLASMIVAFGRMRLIRATWSQLLGNLSIKREAPVL